MGTSPAIIMLYHLFVLLPAAFAVPLDIKPLGQGTGNDMYKPIDPEHYTPDEVYKAANKDDCHPVEKLTYVDECIPYVEKTCFTQQKELCKDVYEKNCTDVIELLCQLGESVQYEMVDETYTVQRCTKVSDRICDTVYDLSITTKDDFQCVDIDYQYCWDEEKIVKDRTCIFSVDFDCGKYKPKDGKGAVGCQKTPTKKCYDTPRKVSEQLCKPRTDKWCEKFTNEIPFPVEKQSCHNEAMKKCELEVRTRPKKAKQYTYTKECKPVVRQVCEDAEKKKLRPVCDKIQKNVCSYKPQEHCQEEEKKYCFKTEKKVWEQVCTKERKEIIDDTFSYV